jgi:Mg-chelatase subunit ChlD
MGDRMTLKKINEGLVRRRSPLDALRKAKERDERQQRLRDIAIKTMPGHEALVMLLDASGSMLDAADGPGTRVTKLQAAIEAARVLVEASIEGVTSVGVIMFGSTTQLLSGMNRDLSSVLDRLHVGNVSACGSTRMDRGLEAAVQELQGARNPVRRIILMSDGVPDDPMRTLEIAEEVSGKGIVIDTVAFGRDADLRFLEGVSGYSKGVTKSASSAKDLRLTFGQLDATTRGLLSSGD